MMVLSLAFFAASILGLCVLVVQLAVVRRRRPAPAAVATQRPGISILKPLCGVDDDLADNIAAFAELAYPNFELLLGVRSAADPAWPLAAAAADMWPSRVRVLIQQGEPGLNRKVNQLVTLAQAACHEILVVSDSNVRVAPNYLDDIAARFEDASVGLVTHPIVGVGARRLGSVMDSLHLVCSVAPGVIAAQRLAGRDIVVGKSMALRRSDLTRLGGFTAFRNVLAEDYQLGLAIRRRLGRRVDLSTTPAYNVTRDHCLRDFFARQRRWSVIQRQGVGRLVYSLQAFLNPTPLALLGLAAAPGWSAAAGFAGVLLAKLGLDLAALRLLAPNEIPARRVVWSPFKDLILFAAWLKGQVTNSVEWRGARLRVGTGTVLVAPVARADGLSLAPADAVEASAL